MIILAFLLFSLSCFDMAAKTGKNRCLCHLTSSPTVLCTCDLPNYDHVSGCLRFKLIKVLDVFAGVVCEKLAGKLTYCNLVMLMMALQLLKIS